MQILCADHPKGPFRPVVNGPVTPENWECLDGTLFFQNGEIYLIFCHEWIQTGDGEICGVRLNGELTRAIEPPRTLFRASEAKGCVSIYELKIKKKPIHCESTSTGRSICIGFLLSYDGPRHI